MTTKEKINKLCHENGTTIRGLERTLGYSNASIAGVKNISFGRLKQIADYFGISVDYFSNDAEEPKMEITKDEQDILDEIRAKPYLKQMLFAGGRVDQVQAEAITYALKALAK